ncbi:MAG: Asp-tRNA(Asn)/Glu-tRNA(Gln) amidotransferase subunit GatB [Clostridiales bacterium]|nr:Asp-tRNA(Asn)/Glu-tRNA(Gln) amidotransferase subunit GatB [Clostridiales bacterium]
MSKAYETVIGLEVHVELATKTKIFCACSTEFGGVPNSHTCPVCTGMPGALPVLNKRVVEYAIAVGLAINGNIRKCCQFDRKNYFYPDNPQNYQISQLYLPICTDGSVEIPTDTGKKTIGIREMHMEEDAGKLLHSRSDMASIVDYNRSGVPLLEIVTRPDIRSAKEAVAFLEKLRLMLQYLGVSDCKLNEGSMRVDVNVSVRKEGADRLGTRTEMKNLNSFRAVARAIESESSRHRKLLENGQKIMFETRRWDDKRGISHPMRTKEEARDYRYFPEPDLPPILIEDAWIARIEKERPEMPEEKLERYQREFGLPKYDASILVGEKHFADLFEEATALCGKPKKVSNWIMGELICLLRENEMAADKISFSPENLAKLIDLVDAGQISGTVAKEIFAQIVTKDVDPEKYMDEKCLGMVEDEDLLREVIVSVICVHSQSVEDYKRGKKRAIGFLVGQAMKTMRGKANPKTVHRLLEEALSYEEAPRA